MTRVILLIPILFLLSCQTLPVIHAPSSLKDGKAFICPSPFLKGKYRLVHAIENRVSGQAQSSVIGITVADPVTRSLSCAIVTVEGMSLFEAESGPAIFKINRALPPFDSEAFANNMIEDIKLIFFIPEGKLQNKGYISDGSKACRYLQTNGDLIDVMENESDGVQIKRYSSSGRLKRHVLFGTTVKNIYQHIELRAYETFNYSLLMNLIEAQPVKTQMQKRK